MAHINHQVNKVIVLLGWFYQEDNSRSFNGMVAYLEQLGCERVDEVENSGVVVYQHPERHPNTISVITFQNDGAPSIANNYQTG